MQKWTVQHVSSSRLSSDLIKSTCRVTYLFFLWTLYLTKEIWFFGSLEGPATTGHMGNQGSHIQQRQIGSLQYVQKTTHRYKCLRQHTMRHRSTIMQLYIFLYISAYTYNDLYIYMHTLRHTDRSSTKPVKSSWSRGLWQQTGALAMYCPTIKDRTWRTLRRNLWTLGRYRNDSMLTMQYILYMLI